MPIIIHASRDLAKRYQCDLSLPGDKALQTGRLDSWSGHFFRISREPMVLMMNDATLWSVIIPAKGVTRLPALLSILLERIAGIWAFHGAAFDPLNQNVLFFSRSNRSLIGSMNEAIFNMRFAKGPTWEKNQPTNWSEVEEVLNGTPYGALKYALPRDLLPKMLSGGG